MARIFLLPYLAFSVVPAQFAGGQRPQARPHVFYNEIFGIQVKIRFIASSFDSLSLKSSDYIV